MEGIEDTPTTWPVVGTRDLHRDDWVVALREDRVHRPGHPDEVMRRLVLEHPGAAVVLAVDEEQRVCCLRQYRHAAGGVLTELPAGLLDVAGEDPRLAAERELREEAELQATSWHHLLTLNPSAGITTERQHVYLATGLSFADRGDFELKGEEAELEVIWVPMDDLVEAVLDQRITEAPMAAAVLAYDALRRRGRL